MTSAWYLKTGTIGIQYDSNARCVLVDIQGSSGKPFSTVTISRDLFFDGEIEIGKSTRRDVRTAVFNKYGVLCTNLNLKNLTIRNENIKYAITTSDTIYWGDLPANFIFFFDADGKFLSSSLQIEVSALDHVAQFNAFFDEAENLTDQFGEPGSGFEYDSESGKEYDTNNELKQAIKNDDVFISAAWFLDTCTVLLSLDSFEDNIYLYLINN